MAEGEELPPVVAVVEGDDSSLLAMFERDIEATRAFASEIQATLTDAFGGGITVSGSQISGQGIGAAGEIIGEQLATGIEEGAAGLDLRPEMEGAVSGAAETGQIAGDELAAGMTEGAAGVGEAITQEVTEPLTAGMAEAGVAAGEALDAGLAASTATVGEVIAAQISEQLRLGLDAAAQATMGVLGQVNASGFAGTLASSAAGAGFLASLSASVSDAAAEAGGIAGVELSRNLSEAAVAALSDEQFAQFTDMLVATASTAGTEAGAAAAESLGASLNTSLVGVDLIGLGLSSVGQSMTAGAQAAAQQAADAMVQVEEATLSGTQAYEAELDAVFESIWHSGQGMTVQLAAAMTEAFQGIEADTSGFTAAETAIFTEFYQALNQLGDQAALDLAERLRLVTQAATSGADLMASGMSTIGLPALPAGSRGGGAEASAAEHSAAQLAAENAAAMGEMGAAADTAAVAAGGLGAAMGGPLMWGLLGVAGMLPMLSGLFNSGSQAAQAYAQAQAQLQQAVSQDSNMIGANTVATIANQLATSGAAATLQGYGISLSTATAAMAGASSAQTDVNGTLQNQIDNLQGLITEQEAHAASSNAQIDTEKQQLLQLQATQQGMRDLENDVVNAVAKQNELTQATLNAEQAIDVFQVQVKAGVLALQQQAQAANVAAAAQEQYLAGLVPGTQAYTDAVNNQSVALEGSARQAAISAQAQEQYLQALQPGTVAYTQAVTTQQGAILQSADSAAIAAMAQLNLGDATTLVQEALYGAVDAYGRAAAGASGYKTVVDDLNGVQMTFDQAQNTLAQDMLNAEKSFKASGESLDLNTAAGVANRQALVSASQAIIAMGVAQYETTGDLNSANGTIQQQIDAYVKATGATGKARDAILAYLEQITKIPPNVSTTATANTAQATAAVSDLGIFALGEIDNINNTWIKPVVDPTPAQQQMIALSSFISSEIDYLNTQPISPPVNAGTGGRALSGRAGGGPVEAGHAYMVGENREPEVFVAGADGYITPMDMLTPAFAAPSAGGGAGYGSFGASAEPYAIIVPVYVDGNLVTTSSRTRTQWYKRRNGVTGFE